MKFSEYDLLAFDVADVPALILEGSSGLPYEDEGPVKTQRREHHARYNLIA